jgi:release factor glutamine methyltransferase
LVEVSETPNLDAQTLLAYCIGKPRAWILTHPEERLTDNHYQAFQADIEKLKKGVPLPYLIGHWEFFGLEFTLTQDTLIPRPETELLVEKALNWLDRHPEKKWAADVGTGSGCIAVTLAKVHPTLSVIATDISYPALKVGQVNSSHHNVAERVHLIHADLLSSVAQRFDLICANLPYIPTEILPTLKVSKGEPKLALDGGENGLDLIRRFLKVAPDHLAPGGCLLLEIEKSQGIEVHNHAQTAFPRAEVSIQKDLAGLDRMVSIQLSGNS